MPLSAGDVFHFWTVISPAAKRGKNAYWLCRCSCGTEREVQANTLVYGKAHSCGCQKNALLRAASTTHGMHTHGGYKSWQSLRQRCNNPKDSQYRYYGGRGITVCAAWDTSFEAFWADMGSTWFVGATIERKDSNGNYEPDNCCWITRAAQPKNRRNVPVLDTPWGQMLLPEAAKHVGLSVVQMQVRYRNGWRGDKLFSAPAEKGARITPRVHDPRD